MPDDFDINIRRVNESGAFKDQGGRRQGQERKKKETSEGPVLDHFQEISASVELAHQALERKHSPYRFRVYREDNEVFIDIILLDDHGGSTIVRKNITDQEFSNIIKNIETLDGILIDYTA